MGGCRNGMAALATLEHSTDGGDDFRRYDYAPRVDLLCCDAVGVRLYRKAVGGKPCIGGQDSGRTDTAGPFDSRTSHSCFAFANGGATIRFGPAHRIERAVCTGAKCAEPSDPCQSSLSGVCGMPATVPNGFSYPPYSA